MIEIWESLIIDVLNTLISAICCVISFYFYRKYKHSTMKYATIASFIIIFAPLFEIFALTTYDKVLAEIFVKISGISANVSVFPLIALALYSLNGSLDWKTLSLSSFILGISIYDIATSNVNLYRIGYYWNYTIYYSPIGALTTSMLVTMLVVLYFLLGRTLVRALKGSKKQRTILAGKTFFYGTVVGSIIVAFAFALDIVLPIFARYLGPLGVLVFIITLTISFKYDPYLLMLLPFHIKGFIIFRDTGILLANKFYQKEIMLIESSLISAALSAVTKLLSEVFKKEIIPGILKLKNITCVIVKHQKVICVTFVEKFHPEILKRCKSMLIKIHEKIPELPRLTVATSEHVQKILEIAEEELNAFILNLV